ncbi:MAG: aminoglycoside phosphotransferase family protein [Anaerolineae bacterium]|nr:aminoglycoside phosphotransferase family protein [Anaerolineae bacterium]
MAKEIGITEVHQICARHQITVRDVTTIEGSFRKEIFFINQEFLLRVSEAPMTHEQEKFRRVGVLPFVPKIIHTGMLQQESGPIYYTFLTLMPGDDFVNTYHQTSEMQHKQLGKEAAKFLDGLHEIIGMHYDIGLYIPVLPDFSGSWREGHQQYWEKLFKHSQRIPLSSDSARVFQRSFQYMDASADVLAYQIGPKLLHNDFHPKNILLHQGKFSAVIDWECSQFGEPDFELCHLLHWCLYPPDADIDFRTFLRSLFEASPICTQVPDLSKRLTIYEIEHEIQQIIWSEGQAESVRVPRLSWWLDGGVDDLLREIGI